MKILKHYLDFQKLLRLGQVDKFYYHDYYVIVDAGSIVSTVMNDTLLQHYDQIRSVYQ